MTPLKYQSCIEACHQCVSACNQCLAACLGEEDPKSMARCIALDIDCAEVCQLAAAAMSRDSELAQMFCGLCAEICEACGDECAQHPMAHCRDCAVACQRCAAECRRMALQPREQRLSDGSRAAHH